MKIGFIGLKNSGKSTIFSTLTGIETDISAYTSQKQEPNLGVVEVADERVNELSLIYEPKKMVYATVEFLDFIGLKESNEKKDFFSGAALAQIKTADALAIVVRNFHDEIINESHGEPTPWKNVGTIDTELIISDLIIAENRLEKLDLNLKRGVKDNKLILEKQTLEKVIPHLNDSQPLRTLELKPEEEKAVRGFQFLSQKPTMVILNSDENNYGKNADLIKTIESLFPVMEIAGKFEFELSRLNEEEAREFLEDIGINTSARNRLISFTYKLLGYISFFTVGKDEVRAWTIISGQSALEAAGKIHTDLERGFIRAECFTYNDIIFHKSEKILRDKGLLHLEGKKYLVKDGDILMIRFNV